MTYKYALLSISLKLLLTTTDGLLDIHLYKNMIKVKYDIQFKPRAIKDIEAMPSQIQSRVIARIEELSDNLKGDIKRLTDSTAEYRLRVGEYRVLFEIEEKTIIIYRIRHRREAYR